MKRVRMLLAAVYVYFALLIAELSAVYCYINPNIAMGKAPLIIGTIFTLAVLAAAAVLIVFNIIAAFRQYAAEDYTVLRRSMKSLKLGLIPFFVLNFLLCMAIAIVIFAASRGFAIFIPWVWLWIICAIGITYFITAGTSAYGILFVRTLRKKGLISGKRMVLHIVLQLCFVTDMIDTLVLLKGYKTADLEK